MNEGWVSQLEYGRFADTYNCIKTALHDTDTDILATSPKFCVGPNIG